MANRVVITICGEEYTLVADETSAYMQKVGSCVSDKMTEVMNDAKVGRTDAAVLTAVNLTDELFKSQAAAEQLRGQGDLRHQEHGGAALVQRFLDERDVDGGLAAAGHAVEQGRAGLFALHLGG